MCYLYITLLPMQTTEKVKLGLYIDESLDRDLRVLAANHRKNISDVASEIIRHCLSNRHFLDKLKDKYTKEPEY